MSDALGAAGSLSDGELERRLRATYVALARSTRHGRTTLDARAAGPTWRRQPLRLVMVAAAVVLLAGLGAVVTQRRDDGASGALDGPRWAIVTPGSGWQYLGIAPYDRAVDGLGAHVGEVIRFGRGDAVLRVMSLRDPVVDDGLVPDELTGAPLVFATPDGRRAVRDLADGLTLVLALEGEVDAGFRPDLVELARQAVTVGEDAWRRLPLRQGFATLGRVGRAGSEPVTVFRFDDLEVERMVTGSLRGGVYLAYSTGTVGFGGTPAADEETGVVVASATGQPSTIRATADVSSVEIGGTSVTLHPIVDPDSGVTVRWGSIELEPGSYEVVGRDAAGAVVFRERTRVEGFDEVTP